MAVKVAGVILAGGQSTRMGGGDKSLRELGGRPLLDHVIERLRPQADGLLLNANGDASRFSTWDIPVVSDTIADVGPLGGIHAGLSWAARQPQGYSHILTVAADTPFFPETLAQLLITAEAGTGTIVLASSDGRVHPTFGLWPITLRRDLEAFLSRTGSASVKAFAEREHGAIVVDFPLSGEFDPFFNVNTPEDLAAARNFMRTDR